MQIIFGNNFFLQLNISFFIISMKNASISPQKILGSTLSKFHRFDSVEELRSNKSISKNLPTIKVIKINSKENYNESDEKKKLKLQQILYPLKQLRRKQELNQNYEFRQKVGQGAFAQVKIAYDRSNQKNVVVKIYEKYKLYDKQRKLNIKNEINILKKLDHPNIIKLIEVIENSKSINLVMQYFSVKSLKTFINQSIQLQEYEVRKIIKQLASALQYLHQNKISHRDIKLQNVLINEFLEVKLIDFGFSLLHKEQQFSECMLVGTPSYMCPQIINKKQYNPYKADVWALGILFYYISIGYFPFRGDSKVLYKRILKGELLFPQNINPGCQYLIKKMLNTNSQERISASEILNDTWIKPVNFKQQINLIERVMSKKNK